MTENTEPRMEQYAQYFIIYFRSGNHKVLETRLLGEAEEAHRLLRKWVVDRDCDGRMQNLFGFHFDPYEVESYCTKPTGRMVKDPSEGRDEDYLVKEVNVHPFGLMMFILFISVSAIYGVWTFIEKYLL